MSILKIVLLSLLVLWGVAIAVHGVLVDPIWERGASQSIGAIAVVALAVWAASRLWRIFRERGSSEY